MREAEARAGDLYGRFAPDELRLMFTRREHDSLFSYVSEPVTSELDKRKHIGVWNGYEMAVGSRYFNESNSE